MASIEASSQRFAWLWMASIEASSQWFARSWMAGVEAREARQPRGIVATRGGGTIMVKLRKGEYYVPQHQNSVQFRSPGYRRRNSGGRTAICAQAFRL